MKSPFPGMDPYLEQYWRDVHHSLITYARDQLQPRLPGGLRSRIEERIFVETEEGARQVFYPDLEVIEHPRARSSGAAEEGIALAEPEIYSVAAEPVTQGYIEIIDVGTGHRVVTVIEFLSPSNKLSGEGQDLYLKKQREVRQAGASLVEIDLTRTGRRNLVLPEGRIAPELRTPYEVCVSRGWTPEQVEVYRLPLAKPLPAIRIPLRQGDADVPLDLQALVDRSYANGAYDDLDYRADARPALDAADAAWADELLRAKGLR